MIRQHDNKLILLTGATGYVGGRLLRVLEHQGHRVRCLARRPEFLKPKVSAATEIVAGEMQMLDGRGTHSSSSHQGDTQSQHGSDNTNKAPAIEQAGAEVFDDDIPF